MEPTLIHRLIAQLETTTLVLRDCAVRSTESHEVVNRMYDLAEANDRLLGEVAEAQIAEGDSDDPGVA